MSQGTLSLALVHEVFHDKEGARRLGARLAEARKAGGELAVLPELPLNNWSPSTRAARDEDAEEPGGPRHRLMAAGAREAGIAVVGGVILRDPDTGRRTNRALLFDASGRLVAAYDKLHLPSEEGFWETDHYEAGDDLPDRIDGFGLSLGLQLCSDLNRPEGCHLLGARGVEAILAPRATPPASYERWLMVARANAVTSSAYVVSVNRPSPEPGVDLGGPSFVAAPDGRVFAESEDPVRVVGLDRGEVERARREYPGYLPLRTRLYARGWSESEDA